MPAGYAAFFLWVAAAVLWWSGWREETASGIPDRAVAVFLAGWPMTAWKNTPLSADGTIIVNGAFMWTALAMAALALRMPPMQRWTAVSAGVLTGSSAALLTLAPLTYTSAPDWAPVILAAAVAGLVTPMLVKGAAGQILSVSAAAALYEALSAVWPARSDTILIGSGRWMECWWLAVLSARLLSVLAEAVSLRFGRSRWRREGEGT